jgi:cyclic pyranopterin phosphate synthase
MPEILTYEEICTIAETAAELGIRHIKLTGGEPLVRRGVISLVERLKAVPGIEAVTMTTNGILLEKELPALMDAGLDAVNISLDTMEREKYREITGTDGLDTVLSAIRAACAAGRTGLSGPGDSAGFSAGSPALPAGAVPASGRSLRVKINAVSLDLGEDNLHALIDIAKTMPVDVRFIEMMPIGFGRNFPAISHTALLEKLKAMYPGLQKDDRRHGYGPAVYYTIPGYQGSVGLISAIHGKFCGTCNRVRLTSQGYLKTCLCYNDGADLRAILRAGMPETEMRVALSESMREAIFSKPDAHCFDKPAQITENAGMNAIGG